MIGPANANYPQSHTIETLHFSLFFRLVVHIQSVNAITIKII